jgi:hypothetical protein
LNKQSKLAARWEMFKQSESTFRVHVPSALGRPAEVAWGIGVVAGGWGVSLAWPNLALTLAAAVLFSLALPLTRKRCMLRIIGIMVRAEHIFWLCGFFSCGTGSDGWASEDGGRRAPSVLKYQRATHSS